MQVWLKQRLHLWILDNVCLLYAGVLIKKNVQNDQIHMHLKTSDVLFQENEPMFHVQ